MESLGRRRTLQQTQRFPRHALARYPRRRRIIALRNAAALAIGAGTITPKDQLILMPCQKPVRELSVSRQRIVARICRKIAIQIWVIGQ